MHTVRKGSGYVAIGGLGLLLSVGYLWMAFRLPFGELDRPGAAIFPVLVGAIVAIASVAAMWEGWRMDPADRVELPGGAALVRLVGFLGALLGYIVLLPWLGHLVASIAFCIAVMYVLTRDEPGIGWSRMIVAALLMSGSIYVVFVHLLKVPMPRGLLAP